MPPPLVTRPLGRLLLLSLFLVVGPLFLLNHWYEQQNHHATFVEREHLSAIHQRVYHIQNALEQDLTSVLGLPAAEREVATWATDIDLRILLVLDARNRVLLANRYEWRDLPVSQVLPDFEPERLRRVRQSGSAEVFLDQGGDRVVAYAPLIVGQDPDTLEPVRGALLLISGLDEAKQALWAETASPEVWLRWLASFLAFALLVGWMVRRWVLLPLQRLEWMISRLVLGDYGVTSQVQGSGVLMRLAQHFDSLSQRLAESQAALLQHQDELEALVAQRTSALTSTNQRLRFVQTSMDRAPVGICWVRPQDSGFDYVNWRFCEQLGYSREELMARRVMDIAPEFPQMAWDSHLAQARGHEVIVLDTYGVHKQGHTLPVEVTVRLVASDEGTERLVAFVTDLTQRRRAELQHRLNEQRLNALWELNTFASTHDEVALMRHAAQRVAAFAAVGHVWFTLYGGDSEQLHAYGWSEGHSWERDLTASCSHCCVPVGPVVADWDQVADKVEACIDLPFALDGGGGYNLPVYHGQQMRFMLHVRGEGFPEEKVEQLRLLAQELWYIIHRRRTEEALVQARHSAEAANRAKSAFLANMSHELRTPLNAMLGHAQIMQSADTLPAGMRRSVGIIQRSGDYLLSLINDVLDLAKVEAGRLDLDPGPCDLHALLRGLDELFRIRTQDKGLAFAYQPSPGLPRRVLADERRLRQVLMNLLGNAVKFTSQGEVRLEAGYSNGHLQLAVVDTGIGLPADRLAGLFQPFHQEGDVEYRSQGTGLGLAISKSLVEQMGGEIGVESRLGVGSRFALSIPLPVIDAPGGGAVHAPGHLGQRYRRTDGGTVPLRILLVDDVADNRDVLRGLLTPLGFEVLEVAGGEAALALLAEESVDLVLMDLVMPGINGLESTRRILALPGLASLPIIACSASAFDEDRANSAAAGCVAHLAKPVQRELLQVLLADHLPLRWLAQGDGDSEAEEVGVPCRGDAEPEATLDLDDEEREVLLALVQRGRILELRKRVERLPQAECGPLLELREAVARFDLKAVRRLLEG